MPRVPLLPQKGLARFAQCLCDAGRLLERERMEARRRQPKGRPNSRIFEAAKLHKPLVQSKLLRTQPEVARRRGTTVVFQKLSASFEPPTLDL